MECTKHTGRPMNMVCGEPVCGSCYGEQLVSERMPKGGYRQGPELVLVHNEHTHVDEVRTVQHRQWMP